MENEAGSIAALRTTLLGFIGKEPKHVDVPLGDGSGTVRVGVMTGNERDRFERLFNQNKGSSVRALLLCFTVLDPETNKRVFDERDLGEIGQIPSDILADAFRESWKLNKLGEAEVKEEEKN